MLFTGSATTRLKDNLKIQLSKIIFKKKSRLTGVKNSKNRFLKVTQKKHQISQKRLLGFHYFFLKIKFKPITSNIIFLEKVIRDFSNNNFFKRGKNRKMAKKR